MANYALGFNNFYVAYNQNDSESGAPNLLLQKLGELGVLLADLFDAWTSLVDSIYNCGGLLLLPNGALLDVKEKTNELRTTLHQFRFSTYPQSVVPQLMEKLTDLQKKVLYVMNQLMRLSFHLACDIKDKAEELNHKASQTGRDTEHIIQDLPIFRANQYHLANLFVVLRSSVPQNMVIESGGASQVPDLYLVDPSSLAPPLPPPPPPALTSLSAPATKTTSTTTTVESVPYMAELKEKLKERASNAQLLELRPKVKNTCKKAGYETASIYI